MFNLSLQIGSVVLKPFSIWRVARLVFIIKAPKLASRFLLILFNSLIELALMVMYRPNWKNLSSPRTRSAWRFKASSNLA
ncbi:MAG: hypothetical protein BWY48_00545 [Parcubacteria group bacterium ADurb.Bin305]|nr:MAG: hypothetical protein BWY48_00545 [Parcubacteria group bacterium ADurb.Bin305]